MSKIIVIVPNWNGADSLAQCLDSLMVQTIETNVLVVDNGSVDKSLKIVKKYSDVKLIKNSKNRGFAGGVNAGFRFAIDNNYDYVASLNNDAVVGQEWLAKLVESLDNNKNIGIATSKILNKDGNHIDSTGDFYTVWGLAYPRGRKETNLSLYDKSVNVFGGSGGASLYRVSMLKQIGLFDEAFFAYYEDVDLSFRAQLGGWKVRFVPSAVVYHQIGATSSKIKGFTTYHTMKNLPLLLVKNVPRKYIYKLAWRFNLAYLFFIISAIIKGRFWSCTKGLVKALALLPRAYFQRRQIQTTRIVPDHYIWSIIVHDLPPNARMLRVLRYNWWQLKKRGI
jgi:hypothetical protein